MTYFKGLSNDEKTRLNDLRNEVLRIGRERRDAYADGELTDDPANTALTQAAEMAEQYRSNKVKLEAKELLERDKARRTKKPFAKAWLQSWVNPMLKKHRPRNHLGNPRRS